MTNAEGGNFKPSPSLIFAGTLIVAFGILVLVASLTVLQLPDAVTEEAQRTEKLYWATLVISMVIYFGVTAGIIWAVFRYRRRRADEFPEQVHGSSTLEIVWTVIPIIILVALFIPSLIMVIDLKTPPDASEIDVEMEAVGHQWWWEFVYCEKGDCEATTNLHVQRTPPNYANLQPPRMVVPVGETVRIKVRSTDVIHSFSAPNLLYKIQAVPGNVNELHFKMTKAGVYTGQCYQFCGLRHSDMLFVIEGKSAADYQSWLNQQKRAQNLPVESDLAADAEAR